MPDDRQTSLLAVIRAAGLPQEEPVMGWLRYAEGEPEPLPAEVQLEVGENDDVLLMPGGRVRYHVRPDGAVDVFDERDPRSMRHQRYDPRRTGQPYMSPYAENFTVPRST